MFFEFSTALKYLIPRWRQFSTTIISLISIAVIALIVWLILVFFSVTNGMEKNWIEKLVSLSAPVRITPTEAYYKSYYYLIDGISHSTDYSYQSIGEKLETPKTNPYDPSLDREVPSYWPKPDLDKNFQLRDIVKLTFDMLSRVKYAPHIYYEDYEMTIANMRLNLLRQNSYAHLSLGWDSQSFLTQLSYLSSYPSQNPQFNRTISSPTAEDLTNLLALLTLSCDTTQEDQPNISNPLPKEIFQERLHTFFHYATITHLKTPSEGWLFPKEFYPSKDLRVSVCALMEGNDIQKIFIPITKQATKLLQKKLLEQGLPSVSLATLSFSHHQLKLIFTNGQERSLLKNTPIFIEGDVSFPVEFKEDSIAKAHHSGELLFSLNTFVQTIPLNGLISLEKFKISHANLKDTITDSSPPLWYLHNNNKGFLPNDPDFGNGILLPKSFRDSGSLIGDRGYLSYYTLAAGSMQEQRLPIYVSGFYDPGLTPIGGKLVITSKEITSIIRSSLEHQDRNLGNGINIWFDDPSFAPQVRDRLRKQLHQRGLAHYWKVEAYEDYDFAKDFVQQLRSDKTLFSLIAIIITIVACSNIISMLILLVNDKKKEVGILLSMGASPRNIATIFGICGFTMGVAGSFFGTLAAIFTLNNLEVLVNLLSSLQGHNAFNTMFYGEKLPNELSYEALTFVLFTTAITSLIAGIVPAIKASLLRPSDILRSE